MDSLNCLKCDLVSTKYILFAYNGLCMKCHTNDKEVVKRMILHNPSKCQENCDYIFDKCYKCTELTSIITTIGWS